MDRCPKRGNTALIPAQYYEPEGTIPLYGGVQEFDGDGKLTKWLICTNPNCEDGKKN